MIPIECFRALMNDQRLDDIPLILETPIVAGKESTADAAEVKLLYSMIEEQDNQSQSSDSTSSLNANGVIG
jgi:endonuclease IV